MQPSGVSFQSAFEQRVELARQGTDLLGYLRSVHDISNDDFVLLLSSNDNRCNEAALSGLSIWVQRRNAKAFVLHRQDWASANKYAQHDSKQITFLRLSQESIDALLALYLTKCPPMPWFKVATLEGRLNSFRLIDSLESPAYSLEESFARQLYIMDSLADRASYSGFEKKAPKSRSKVRKLLKGIRYKQTHAKVPISTEHLSAMESAVPILNQIVSTFGSDTTYFYIRQKPIGDIYFSLQCIRTLFDEGKVSKYAIIGTRANVSRLRQLMAFFWEKEDRPKLLFVEPKEIVSLIDLTVFLGTDAPASYIETQYYGAMPHERKVLLANRPGLEYVSFLKAASYGLSRSSAVALPKKIWDEAAIKDVFREKGLQLGKTVILSPYTVSGVGRSIDLSMRFWEKLAEDLQAQGYSVATNLSSESESPVQGTVGLFFSLQDAPGYLDAAGALVSVRSGFCDLATASSCKKTILYPSNLYPTTQGYRCGTYADFWSLASVEKEEDLLELVYQSPEGADILPLISGFLSQGEGFQTNYHAYESRIQKYRSFQQALLQCEYAEDYARALNEHSAEHPIAVLMASRGKYRKYFSEVPWDALISSNLDTPDQQERIVGIWDSVSNSTDCRCSDKEDLRVQRQYGSYTANACIVINKDDPTQNFNGFEIAFNGGEHGNQVLKFQKEDANEGINIAVFSLLDYTVIDCINLRTGYDSSLLVRRFR